MAAKKTASVKQQVCLDSSCWLEFFANTPRAKLYEDVIAQTDELLVPIITIYEVYKVAFRQFGGNAANQAIALMREGQVIDIGLNVALSAAASGLPMADSLIYATAQTHGAVLWTQDQHFKGLPGVNYLPKI